MKSTIYNFLQRQSLRLSLCAMILTASSVAFAQDDFEDEENTTIKAPKRKQVVETNTLISVQGIVVDDATKAPLAGVRIQALNDVRYTSMTDDEGKFTIKVPDFTTSLYVQSPMYLSQQVSIIAGDEKQQVRISMLSDAFTSTKTIDNCHDSTGPIEGLKGRVTSVPGSNHKRGLK